MEGPGRAANSDCACLQAPLTLPPTPPPRYDAIHNPHLGLAGLDELYAEAKALADAVIPNE